ncbi:hypothetical protein H6B15_11180 [Gemmiger formicilis]|uniref:hypothetical protein n=1 Tax=Gemmiger formicilis TaxID=745368 RepID=UPI00195E99C6|nr:hypothetical protein [Gemmiger formicilis]MBM6717212.1 hypothetical protein [Gemmiger formicilis]
MSLKKRLAALAMAGVMALTLTACSPKEMLSNAILTTATVLGFRDADAGDEDEAPEKKAEAGGSITFPDGMETTGRFVNEVHGDTLYIAFNGIANRSTDYFVAGGDSVTVTAYATTDSATINEFKAAIWELSDDRTQTSYVQGTTVYFATGGECSTATISGLTPGKMYKVYISYDSSSYYITGAMTVTGVGSEEMTTVENEDA